MKSGFAQLSLILVEETAVLIRWQRHAHALAVELVQTFDGWAAAAHYFRTGEEPGFAGLCDVWRGPYPSREAAIRNTVAHLVHQMLPRGLSACEALRIYTAAHVPIPPKWPRAAFSAPKVRPKRAQTGSNALKPARPAPHPLTV